MGEKTEKIFFEIELLFLAIVSVGIFGIGGKYILLALFMICAMRVFLDRNLCFDKEALVLLIGMLAYSIGARLEIEGIIKNTLLPVLFYYYGKSTILLYNREKREYRSKVMLLVLSIGLLIGSALNAFSWHKNGFDGGRAWAEFWTGHRLPATQHIFWSVLIVAFVFYGIYYWKKERLVKGILVLGGMWSVYFSLITKSRALAVIFGMVFIINIILYCYFNWCDERKKSYIKKGMTIILVICILMVMSYLLNIGGIADLIKASMWGRNGGILHNVRFAAQIEVLKQLFKYPFGGKQMDLAGLNYAHNVWLDIANSAGLAPFVLIIIYTVLTVYNLIKLIKNQNIGQEVKYILVSAYTSLFLYYMVEPALDANIMFWAIWMLVCGLIKGNIQESSSIREIG